MMISPTGITISFGGTPGATDDSRAVVARIVGFPTGSSQLVSHEMVVPAGEAVEQRLDQGLYNVQMTLPSGSIIQRNVKIADDTNENYRFFEDFAGGAGFSLQESVGQPSAEILESSAVASGNTSSPPSPAEPRFPGIDELPPVETLDVGATKKQFRSVRPQRRSRPPTARLSIWAGAVALDGSEPVTRRELPQQPVEQRGNSAIWRIHQRESGFSGRLPSTAASAVTGRSWARVSLPDGGVEMASLPLPWLSPMTGELVSAEVLVDPSRSPGASTTVAVRDAKLAGLLSFLDRGQAGSAGPMLAELERDDVIGQTIYSKMRNPLAACAAAYVGLAVYPPGEHERWDQWLENCMVRFPSIPDSAIVHARRLLLRPTDAGDNARAAVALRQACAAGVPYFSTGVLLLREMLVILSADHEDLHPLADQAGILAGRLDTSQAFTVLRYARTRSTRK